MLFNIVSLDIIFQFSLFALLVYKLYGLAKSTLIPFLNEQLLLEKKYQTELLNKEKLLFSSQQRVKNQILSQKQMFILLERNVQIWNLAEQENKNSQEKENKDIILQTQKSRHKQTNQLLLLANTHLSLPTALEQAAQTLTELYAASAGKERLTHIISQLKPPVIPVQKGKG